MERRAKEGDSPVIEYSAARFDMNQSNTGTVMPCMKQGGPFPKTKYML